MANVQGGFIKWDLDIDDGKFNRKLKQSKQDVKGFSDDTAGESNKMVSSFAKAGKAFAATAIGIGATMSALFGKFVIGGGISRALNIEDAQGKLRGLGHDVESIETIMGSALKSVKGTAFGLDAAATAAASAVASGVKPGEQLTDRLSLVGDAATIAGVSFNEMASIFGKVQTQQRAYTMEINQLADRGIPIYEWLQKELGLTQEELREMVAAGEVDSKTYFKAIQKNIGGAALESGKTTRGAWNNLQAAMARVGAAIVEDIIPQVRDSFGDLTMWFDDNSDNIVASISNVIETLKSFGSGFVDVAREIANYLMPKFNNLVNAIRAGKEDFVDFTRRVLQPLASMVGHVLVFALGAAIDLLSLMVGIVRPLARFIADNTAALIGLASALGTVVVAVKVIDTLDRLRVAFNVMRLITIPSLLASLTALSTFLATPMGLAIVGVSIAAGVLAGAFAKNRQESDKLKDSLSFQKQALENLQEAQDKNTDAELRLEGAKLRVERAQLNLNSALEEYGPESLEAKEASLNLKQANLDLRDATDEAAEANRNLLKQEKEYSKSGALIKAAESRSIAVQNLADILNTPITDVPNKTTQPKSYIERNINSADPLGVRNLFGRASGGPVSAKTPYMVGEKGPEIFMPKISGQIIPNNELDTFGGTTINQTNNIYNDMDMEQAMRDLSWRLAN